MIPGVNIFWHIQRLRDVPADNTWLSEIELEQLNRFKYHKRKSDWRLGRWTAKNLLLKHFKNHDLADFDILAAEDGAPEVFIDGKPVDVSISISHSKGFSFCVLNPHKCAIGCDIEAIEERSAAFIADYFTQSEKEFINACEESERCLMANLVWSAKESALKALREGLRLDTRSVEVHNIKLAETDNWRSLSVKCEGRFIFDGWWRVYGDFVLTMVFR